MLEFCKLSRFVTKDPIIVTHYTVRDVYSKCVLVSECYLAKQHSRKKNMAYCTVEKVDMLHLFDVNEWSQIFPFVFFFKRTSLLIGLKKKLTFSSCHD